MIVIKTCLTFLFTLVLFCLLSAQSIKDGLTTGEINKLQDNFPDSEVVNYYSESHFEFNINHKKLLIEVVENSSDVFLALAPNSKAVAYRYYDNYSDLVKNNVEKSNKETTYYRNCGDYEVDGIFFHDNKICAYYMTFPAAGNNIELTSRTRYYDSRYFNYIPLSQQLSVNNMNLTFTIPENIDIELLEFNFENYDIEKTEITTDDGKTRVIKYKINKLPSGAVDNIAGPTWVFPHIIVLSKGFTYDEKYYPVFNSNQDLYNWCRGLVPDNSTSEKARQKALSIVDLNDDQQEKSTKIFNWVKENIRYIAFEDGIAGYKPEEADIVMENKYGDCKGMANLLKEMLSEVGVDARLCWIGTNRISYNDIFPSLVVHNHMICAVSHENDFIFLDATDRYSNYGETGDHIQGRLVMVENGDNLLIDTIKATEYTENQISSIFNMGYDNGLLNIDGVIEYKGEPRRNIQYILNEFIGKDKDKFLETLITNNDTRIKIDELSFGLDSLVDNIYRVNVSMTEKNAVFSHEEQLFIPLDLSYGSPLPEIDTLRRYNYNTDFRISKHYRTILIMPDSLTVEYLPPETQKSINGASYYFNWTQNENRIIYDKKLNIKNRIVDTSEFKQWNSFISNYNELGNQMIIISK